ncbi:hypothetical protein RRG08_035352 [Elysia crispata]|uniref:VWFA domain-containing protein n=1 Tax=Elysia crispata TaxID=231223 RepID=A0AAE0Y3C8_9GAST|nr:hypothetical protein RRG08_035352 [Elysia crispata]
MAFSFALIAVVALMGTVHCQFGSILNECREKEMDIFFLLDSSTSIYVNDFMEQQQFVRDVINRLDINELYTRVGVLTFSDDYTRPALGLSRARSQAELLNSINDSNLPYRTGITNTHLALRYVRENNEFRPGVTKVMVVVTDGGSRQQGSTAREAQLAQDEGFYVFVVGVGQYRDESEWRAMASNPYDRFIFNVTEFRQLSYVATQLPTRACPLPPIFMGTCQVGQPADVIFVAGPANNDRAYDIIENFVDRTRDPRRFLSYTLLLDICQSSAGGIQPSEFASYCNRLNEPGVADESTLSDLVARMENAITINRRANFDARQVIVILMDVETFAYASYTTLRDFASLGNRSGIELVLVGMGMSNRDIDFARSRLIGNVFNVEDGLLEYQETVLRSITDKICEGINQSTPSIDIDAN